MSCDGCFACSPNVLAKVVLRSMVKNLGPGRCQSGQAWFGKIMLAAKVGRCYSPLLGS